MRTIDVMQIDEVMTVTAVHVAVVVVAGTHMRMYSRERDQRNADVHDHAKNEDQATHRPSLAIPLCPVHRTSRAGT